MCKAIHQMFSWVLYGMAYSSVDRHIVAARITNVRILGYLNVVLRKYDEHKPASTLLCVLYTYVGQIVSKETRVTKILKSLSNISSQIILACP